RHYVIDHFFTKLLKLPARMNTTPGRAEADRRVRFMVQFLGRLGDELGEAFDANEWDLLSPAAGERETVLPAEIPMPA
ncbi:MAG: uncharacterized protein QOH86_2034, partial [Sphingomonadales bacterium]|nr:uncharacterized protein [Sphingomonadales bacterium]